MHGTPPQIHGWHGEMVARHGEALRRYALRLLGRREAADDAVQETFLRLLGADAEVIGGHVTQWLYRCCRHRVIDALRKEGRMHVLDETTAAGLASRQARPDEAAGLRDDAARAAVLLQDLAAVDQELLHLRLVAGLGYAEIAEVTGMSRGNVGYRLHHALKTLRGWMEAARPAAPLARRSS